MVSEINWRNSAARHAAYGPSVPNFTFGAILTVPECCRCDEPITGTPVKAEDDPLGREFCSEDCLDSASEAAGGAMAAIEYSSEFD